MKLKKCLKITLMGILFCAAGFLKNAAPVFAQQAEYKIESPGLLAETPLIIKTEWDFFWSKKVSDPESTIKPDLRVTAPSEWNKYALPSEAQEIASTGRGSGTYRLKLSNLKPNTKYAFSTFGLGFTAFTVYANGEEIFRSGIPNVKWSKTIAEQYFDKAVFTSDEKGSAVICIFISNDFYRKGGLRGTFKLIEEQAYNENYTRELCIYGIFCGLLFMIALYCFITAIMKKDKTNLYLGLIVVAIVSRIVSNIFPMLKEVFPSITFKTMLRIEYYSLFVIPSMHTLYFDSLNKKIFGKYLAKILVIPAFVFIVLNTVLPIHLANRMVPVYQIYMFSMAGIDVIAFLIRIIKDKDFISVTAILSFIFLAMGAGASVLALHHILFSQNVSGMVLTASLIIYSFFQIILLAYIQNGNYMKVVRLNNELVITNKAYFRFVPKEFLEILSKKDITEVHAGEYKIAKMAVLSADIRNFTSTSEKLQPIQVFDMLNSYLGRIAPLIRKYNGTIEKYLGDGIIAIFPDSAAAALNCAVEMQEQMISLREDFAKRNMPLIKIGIGIHFGNIVIGTGGEEERMTEISLSNDIDIAIKTEAATKIFDRKIIVTKDALNSAAAEVRAQHERFVFSGEPLSTEDTLSPDIKNLPQLYALYNAEIGKTL